MRGQVMTFWFKLPVFVNLKLALLTFTLYDLALTLTLYWMLLC